MTKSIFTFSLFTILIACGSNEQNDTSAEIQNTDFTYEFNENRDLREVTPPFDEEFNIPKDTLINANDGASIVLESGSFIAIPENAFLDKSGNIVTGEVDVSITEYNDPFSFLASGIPMITAINKEETTYFESAGMIDFNATQNGEELMPNPESEIQVGIASNQEGDYPLYNFEEGKGWTKEEESTQALNKSEIDSVIKTPTGPKPKSIAIATNHFFITDEVIAKNPNLKKYKDYIFAPKNGSFRPYGVSKLTVEKAGSNEYWFTSASGGISINICERVYPEEEYDRIIKEYKEDLRMKSVLARSMKKMDKSDKKILRTFLLRNFRIYNCDRSGTIKAKAYPANISCEEKIQINCLDYTTNSNYPCATISGHISVNQENIFALFGVGANKKKYYISTKECMKSFDGSVYNLNFQPMPEGITGTEIKSFLYTE